MWMNIFHLNDFFLTVINICLLLGGLCSRTSHESVNLYHCAWAFSCFTWAKMLPGHVLWWKHDKAPFQLFWHCHSKDKPSLYFCSRTLALWYFAQILYLFLMVLFTLFFLIKCRFNYLNLSIEKKIYLWFISFSGYPRPPWKKRS